MRFRWIDFYTKFATKLLEYKDDRKTLISKLKKVYSAIKINFPTIEKDNLDIDIDPFTVVGLFNKGITDFNRIKIIRGFMTEFGIDAQVPDSFEGIPVLMNMAATFYYFLGDRKEEDIDNLWKLFEAAIYLADTNDANDREIFVKSYNKVITQRGIRWNISMGLYWIRPYIFINLDSRNRWFMVYDSELPKDLINQINAMGKNVPTGEEYLELCSLAVDTLKTDKFKIKNLPELSYNAWIISEKVNQEKKEQIQADSVVKEDNLIDKKEISKAAFLRWMKPIITALLQLGGSGTPPDVRKRIIENENLSDTEIEETRGEMNVNKFENEVAFARNYLVYGGYIDKSVRGIWTLTEIGKTVDMSDELASDIYKRYSKQYSRKRKSAGKAVADGDVESVQYWTYSPGENAEKWDELFEKGIIAIKWGEIGDLETFADKEEIKDKMKEVYGDSSSYMNSAHAAWQFSREMKIGDIVFAKEGRTKILGRGIVSSEYRYHDNRLDYYNNIRKINWTNKGIWEIEESVALKTLTDITPYTEFVEKLCDLFVENISDEEYEPLVIYPIYTEENFLEDVYMNKESYRKLSSLVKKKKNVILQGAPGVGKTYAAKRLAYSIMGEKDIERVMMIQFHQSYSYEDFVMGFRPSATGFELKKGTFYNFCKKAEIDSDNEYFFIIDEINRGNLSKIFGELFMLIENDKRGIELQLLYSDEKFAIPENVYIIGMMNTADRSLAMMDYALRRRFAFFELKPAFRSDGFLKYKEEIDNEKFNKFISSIENLNNMITEDDTLGEGFAIGHSYFCDLDPDEVNADTLEAIIDYEIIPLLKEYWFDEISKVDDWIANLKGSLL